MNVIIADDEKLAAAALGNTVVSVLGEDTQIRMYYRSEELVKDDSMSVDLAFLDIEMPGMNGLEITKYLKEKYPNAIIVFVTAYSEYALQAWDLGVDGYLMKPVSREDMSDKLQEIFSKRKLDVSGSRRLQAVCFGRFELFCEGRIVDFKRSRAKEMLAYLICAKGASVSTGELCGILWDDASDINRKKTYIRQYAQSIREALTPLGMESLLLHSRGAYAVDTSMLDCDYYRYLDGDPDAIDRYNGEFVIQYEWSDMIGDMF